MLENKNKNKNKNEEHKRRTQRLTREIGKFSNLEPTTIEQIFFNGETQSQLSISNNSKNIPTTTKKQRLTILIQNSFKQPIIESFDTSTEDKFLPNSQFDLFNKNEGEGNLEDEKNKKLKESSELHITLNWLITAIKQDEGIEFDNLTGKTESLPSINLVQKLRSMLTMTHDKLNKLVQEIATCKEKIGLQEDKIVSEEKTIIQLLEFNKDEQRKEYQQQYEQTFNETNNIIQRYRNKIAEEEEKCDELEDALLSEIAIVVGLKQFIEIASNSPSITPQNKITLGNKEDSLNEAKNDLVTCREEIANSIQKINELAEKKTKPARKKKEKLKEHLLDQLATLLFWTKLINSSTDIEQIESEISVLILETKINSIQQQLHAIAQHNENKETNSILEQLGTLKKFAKNIEIPEKVQGITDERLLTLRKQHQTISTAILRSEISHKLQLCNEVIKTQEQKEDIIDITQHHINELERFLQQNKESDKNEIVTQQVETISILPETQQSTESSQEFVNKVVEKTLEINTIQQKLKGIIKNQEKKELSNILVDLDKLQKEAEKIIVSKELLPTKVGKMYSDLKTEIAISLFGHKLDEFRLEFYNINDHYHSFFHTKHTNDQLLDEKIEKYTQLETKFKNCHETIKKAQEENQITKIYDGLLEKADAFLKTIKNSFEFYGSCREELTQDFEDRIKTLENTATKQLATELLNDPHFEKLQARLSKISEDEKNQLRQDKKTCFDEFSQNLTKAVKGELQWNEFTALFANSSKYETAICKSTGSYDFHVPSRTYFKALQSKASLLIQNAQEKISQAQREEIGFYPLMKK